MKRLLALSIALALLTFTTGCDKESETSAESVEGAIEEGGAATDDLMDEVAEAAKYDKSMRKKACDILTAEMVSEAFGVPADELKQTKAMGCIYNWSKDGKRLQVRFGSIRVHENTGAAKRWFEKATKSMTAEETREVMAEITEKAKDDERIDTETKKKATDKVGGMMGEMGSFTFGDVKGVGDEARENVDDGELWIRVGNMTFIVTAYMGPEKPPSKLKMEQGKMKEYMREVQKEQKAWTRETIETRRAAGRKIANMVIEKL